jgi:hypothetical protein
LNFRQKAAVYSITLSYPEIGKNIEAFESSERRLKARRKLQEYAEGGMNGLLS